MPTPQLDERNEWPHASTAVSDGLPVLEFQRIDLNGYFVFSLSFVDEMLTNIQ